MIRKRKQLNDATSVVADVFPYLLSYGLTFLIDYIE